MAKRLLFVLVACVACMACLWDSDTLAIEAKGLPGVLDIVTGRFDRNPPLYYEMRLARVTDEVKRTPANLELYDDAGVACDRLGRHEEAVEWMRRKAEQLTKTPNADHQYRYHANLGTFLVHGWFAAGAKDEDRAVVDEAHRQIARAIELNPDAHFGRERVQLSVMAWLQERLSGRPVTAKTSESANLGTWMRTPGDQGLDRIKGLVGLIALGNAWESPDVFEALAVLLTDQDDWLLAAAAGARAQELISAGRTPRGFVPTAEAIGAYYFEMAISEGANTQVFRSEVQALRRAADVRHQLRNHYMLARLEKGRHPDTDTQFWAEWEEPARPTLSERSIGYTQGPDWRLLAPLLAAIAAAGGLASWLIYKRLIAPWRKARAYPTE